MMTDKKPIWEDFEGEEDNESTQNSKVEEHVVWHELGHLIGFTITKQFDYNFGMIIQLNLHKLNPCIKIESDLFRANNIVHRSKIDFGIGEFIYEQEDQKRLRSNLDDTYRFIVYTIYLLAGGLFNLYAFKKTPKPKDFEICFLDETDEIESNSFKARAGNDWTKLKSLIKLKEWDEKIFLEFRFKLFFLLKNFNIYELFRELIEKVEAEYNGKLIQGTELTSLTRQVSKALKGNGEFQQSLSKLIMHTHQKLINKN